MKVLDERQLDTGIIYQGDMARVRSFMHKLRHQQPVHIGESCTVMAHSRGPACAACMCMHQLSSHWRRTPMCCAVPDIPSKLFSPPDTGALCAAVVGGSISVGLGEDGFGPGVFRRVAAAFPNAPHRFHNGALGGVMSTYMNSCLKWHVPADVDLVIVSTSA
jgi:hypothetical protein